jgi:hypothetical protein
MACALLCLLPSLLVPACHLAAHAVWAFSAVAAHYGSYYAIKYVDPVWSGVSNVVNASEVLVDNFLGLAMQLPVVGGRRLVECDPVNARHVITRQLTQADVDAMPAATREAGLAAGRALQQLPDLVNGLGGLLNTAASALNSANVVPAQVSAQLLRLNDLPFLPQLLPNGSSNPLFSTLSSVTQAVEAQLLNRTGCPAWCIDMRDQSWIRGGCLCNLDRVKVRGGQWGCPNLCIVCFLCLAVLLLVSQAAMLGALAAALQEVLDGRHNTPSCSAQLLSAVAASLATF